MSPEHPADRAPSVIVIGGGIAGLATACYARMSGLRTQVFEKHVLPGGCCTAWGRDGYIFDYCIEWLPGTAAGNDAHRVWQELGALDGKSITNFEMFNRVVGADGREVTFYNDPDRLQRHLLEISPEDARPIRSFCRYLRRFLAAADFPHLVPGPLQTRREKLAAVARALPAAMLYRRTATAGMPSFTDGLRDPLLRRAFPFIFFQDHGGFPLLPYLLNMAAAHHGNAGFPEGGSLGLARSVERRYLDLGGDIRYRARVERILVEGGRAVGVQLRDGTRHHADHVVSACDGATTIYRMLEGRYTGPAVDRLYEDLLHRSEEVYPGVLSAFVGVDGELPPGTPHSTTYLLSEQDCAALPGVAQRSIVVQLRSKYWAGCAPPGKSLLHCTYFTDFASWRELRRSNRREYRARKERVATFVRSFLERRYPGLDDRVESVDVATPVTQHRYTGNFAGSILAWKSFGAADDLLAQLVDRDRMRLPGLRGFSMAGQWVDGGGLIRAASSGRHAAQFLCQELGVPFRAWESDQQEPWDREMLGELPLLDRDPTRHDRRGPR
ncbi:MULTISPECIES: NAD(P)/FAD-dependent oxidoreductase [unclassified Saccharopolyspora]|uniref:phytoene desaturase family protein n=1 Tax=unclassified Saccharopolyspora TaxID=2646250 RepID=UPI001CD3AE72|nr:MULTISPECIES: NAD(P)/FAD-dependent oxidoreductase [unclassified Saccharopolyspora]MCA1190749.1 NAD(P)/FAD-dependent oxidoreductase [Saccharopolyspora sp. 6V]MCA1226246.1 NAD(P)/FAD-dependent oxidoreductase [Saccharopolyspora sp. 6M]MCA1278213.1 NAD(P)/FAD-dependent oxidoreductase [Saccharopolyspora sp. 7B]